MQTTLANPLAELRARLHSIAATEAGEETGTLDLNNPEAWGLDPDLIHDWTTEDRL